MGKNFSANNVNGVRRKSDFYETPYSMTEQFLDVECFDYTKNILEPACGSLAIVQILKRRFDNVRYYDKETNFLTDTKPVDYIITNPPFSLAKEFIIQAKTLVNYKFALLLPLSYLHGKERYDLIYTDVNFKLETVYVFTRYPLLGEPLRQDGKYNTGMMVYAWFVWNRQYLGEPTIKWIDNNSYVLGKHEK